MITTFKAHWITVLAVLGAAFLLFLGFSFITNPDEGREGLDRVFGAVFGLIGIGLLGGLWGLRTGGLHLWVAHALIIVGAITVGMFFWLFLVPLIVALALLYAGVYKRGLERELRRS